MTEIERDLREALNLLDCVTVRGRQERICMVEAEKKIYSVAEFLKAIEAKKKGEAAHDQTDNGQKDGA